MLDIFKFKLFLIITSIASQGLGDKFLGIDMPTNFSTLPIYILFTLQFFSNFKIDKFLLSIYLFIVFHVIFYDIYYFTNNYFYKHYFGFIIFSFSVFSFVSEYKLRIFDIINYYYKFAFYISVIGLFQFAVFIVFNKSFLPHRLLASGSFDYSDGFKLEILKFLPRIVGMSSEPAHFAVLLLPGVFLSLNDLFYPSGSSSFRNRAHGFSIITAFILSFSLVGYVSLFIFLITKFSSLIEKSSYYSSSRIKLFFFLGVFLIVISQINLSKLTNIKYMISNVSRYNFTTSDLSGFALVSNAIITKDALINSNFWGTGLNSHQISYDKYLYNNFSLKNVILELNNKDAGSLYLRVLSEFGVLGLLLFIYFLFKYKLNSIFSNSVIFNLNHLSLVVIFCYALRNGNYLNSFFWLFLAIYFFSYQKYFEKEI